jgi:hypothetical protein
MKGTAVYLLLPLLLGSIGFAENTPAPRVVDLKASDGIVLKGTYFAAAKPGPGALLFHQSNRTRTSGDDVARQLATAGINTLAVDRRAHGESGGPRDDAWQKKQADLETGFRFLISQPRRPARCDWLGRRRQLRSCKCRRNRLPAPR